MDPIPKDGYTDRVDQIWPAVPIVLEVLELVFGCLFALEVVLKLWGIGRSLLAPTCLAAPWKLWCALGFKKNIQRILL